MTDSTEQGTLHVRRSAYGRPPEERERKVPVPDFGNVPTARVAIGMSSTRRMSNEMEFMKVEVRVELPCLPNDEDISETASYAINLIRTVLDGEEPAPALPARSAHVPGTPIA